MGPEGKVVFVRVTTPWKPSMLVMVIVDAQEEPPAAMVMEEGLEESSKSGPFTVTKTTTVTVREAEDAVTMTA